MRWQRIAQAAIAVFVVGFIAVVATTLRDKPAAPAPPPPAREVPSAKVENPGGCEQITAVGGRRVFSLKCGKHYALEDGRQQLTDGVELQLPRGDEEFVVKAQEAEITPKENGIEKAVFTTNVVVSGNGGLEVKSAQASYNGADGVVTVPGAVEFSKGRMRGTGVGATYDSNRNVLTIRQQPRIQIAADARSGEQAMEASADSVTLVRGDHLLRFERNARLTGEGRTLEADEIAIRLTPEEDRITAMELRGNSRITGGQGGPQAMSARDIDLAYAEDGRTLQKARLVENAVLQLAPGGGAAGKSVAASTIDIVMAADGTTVSRLTATQRVVVELPAEGDAPAKQVRSATLTADGASGAGLQNARFAGGAEYRETRPARGKLAAVNRTSRSDSLILETEPGLGAVRKADFRGNVRFRDEPDFTAEAPHGIYYLDRDRLELLPGEGLPGPPPLVSDGKISVAARTINLTVSTRELEAETGVRSTMIPRKNDAASKDARRLPTMLSDNEPVTVTANRLKYHGAASEATYSGAAVLWQGDTQLKGDTITIDDRQGNLAVNGHATTRFFVDEVDAKTGTRKRVETRGGADRFTYDDARRLATYIDRAWIVGAQGDVSGDRIELFMKPKVNELERAEAYGKAGSVGVKEGARSGKGDRLTYVAATDEYLMTGAPVEIIEEKKSGGCIRILGATARFNRTDESASVEGSGLIPQEQKSIPCPAKAAR